MVKESELTEGSLPKKILLFSLPLMFSNILQVLFNMSDIAVVGQFAGSGALGAVGSTTILVSLLTGILIGMGSGVNVIVARCIGTGHEKDISDSVHSALIICLASGVVVMLGGVCFSKTLLEILGTKEDLIAGAQLYLRIYSLGMPALGIYNFGNAVYSAAGNTKKPLMFLLLSGIINVILNLFFVIVVGLDVAGVALASIISQYLSAILVVVSLMRCKGAHKVSLKKLAVNGRWAKQIVGLGLPASLQNSIFAVANLFIQAGVNTFDTVVVEGNSAAANADTLVYDLMAAFYTACSSFMGQNLGAGKRDRVIKSYFLSLAYSFGAALVLGVFLVFAGDKFLMLFTKDPAVAAEGMERLRVMGFSYCVSAFMDCTIAASRGLGKSLIPTIIVIMGSCVFRVIWVYTVFAYFHTLPSLYLLYVFSWTITAIAEITYFAHSWKKISSEIRTAGEAQTA